jgi:phage terminase large subunit
MTVAQIQLPKKLVHLFSGDARYRIAHGGRGSGKTRGFALMSAIRAYMLAEAGKSGTILCAREFMNSLEDSSMEEVKQAIRSVPWLDAYFELGERFIRTRNRRISYTFCGLRHNLDSIKSKARILIAWIDEAETVSEIAWQKLLPTVREEGSEVYISYNPERDGSATDKRFRKSNMEGAKIVEMNYTDNPWFPAVLEQERLNDREILDDHTYAWIWEGAYRENSKAQIFADKYRVADFESAHDWDGPYFGLDFGFSQDPTAGVKMWVHDRRLYIEYEAGDTNIENDDMAQYLIDGLPDIEKYPVVADNARPELISHLKKPDPHRNRPNIPKIEPCRKGQGSVEDGISFLKSFREIVIHTRCKKTLEEFRLYSYKVDRLTGDVLPDIIDKWNHYIDATRYGIEKVRTKNTFLITG